MLGLEAVEEMISQGVEVAMVEHNARLMPRQLDEAASKRLQGMMNTGEALRNLGRDKSGKRRVNKWKCRVCGYIHEGPEPPEECPVCGAPREMFDPVF